MDVVNIIKSLLDGEKITCKTWDDNDYIFFSGQALYDNHNNVVHIKHILCGMVDRPQDWSIWHNNFWVELGQSYKNCGETYTVKYVDDGLCLLKRDSDYNRYFTFLRKEWKNYQPGWTLVK